MFDCDLGHKRVLWQSLTFNLQLFHHIIDNQLNRGFLFRIQSDDRQAMRG